jgi:hypothetical protein
MRRVVHVVGTSCFGFCSCSLGLTFHSVDIGNKFWPMVVPIGDDLRSWKRRDHWSQWSGLPSDLLVQVIDKFLDADAQVALTLSHVCREWRNIILKDGYTLEVIRFRTLNRKGAFPGKGDLPPSLFLASLGKLNVTAHIAQARYLSSIDRNSSAAQHWKIAAKKGHPLAQIHVGLASYEDFNAEDAYLNLKRGCKQLLMAGGQEDKFMMTAEEGQEMMVRACLILGILIIDNDLDLESDFSLDKDYSNAIYWLKIARDKGCHDAAKILQSMFRNGQY